MFSMLLSMASNLPANYQLRLVIPAPPDFPDGYGPQQPFFMAAHSCLVIPFL